VVAARLLGIPSLTHEQTAHLGLATRINSRFSDVIAFSYPDAKLPARMHRARVVVTGNPVRTSIMHGNADRLRETYAVPDGTPVIYVTGGMRGATAVNNVVADALPDLVERAFVLHQCGPRSANDDYDRLLALRAALPESKRGRYHVTQTVGDELGDIYAAARLVIGRAGAGTVAELAMVGKPSILIPLPGAEEQRRNALVLANAGAAIMLPQESAGATHLLALVDELLSNDAKLDAMGEQARSIASPEAASRLVDELVRIVRGSA
jgi:UDP-N-acetylglucosamine--N-acetylmuramyl-(pentapeptide) pyrophosphoryl-undecaprenol N-acetylglucosamine transferase